MKLGKFAKKREKLVLKYLKKKGPASPETIQLNLIQKMPIDVTHALSDLQRAGLIYYYKPNYILSTKGQKYLKKKGKQK